MIRERSGILLETESPNSSRGPSRGDEPSSCGHHEVIHRSEPVRAARSGDGPEGRLLGFRGAESIKCGFMEVTHTTGRGGGPREDAVILARLEAGADPPAEYTHRSEATGAVAGAILATPLLPHPTASHRHERRCARGDPQSPKVESGGVGVRDGMTGDIPTSAGHPTKISPIDGRSSGTASEVRWAVTDRSPGQRLNPGYWRPPWTTGQTARIGLITRRSRGPIPRPGSPLPAIGRPVVAPRARPPARHAPLRRGACWRRRATDHGPSSSSSTAPAGRGRRRSRRSGSSAPARA